VPGGDMSKTRIFVSSTCYDLASIREEIRNCIIELGHTPLLSEYPSFPVLPELKTIENCKRIVRENTDIFILIIGGRRGSLDSGTNKPITNIEYEAAKEEGLDAFIFVFSPVMKLVPVWEKNPNADFTPTVDYPDVFKFIKEINSEQKWIFTFEKNYEIKEIIRDQLSVFLRNLIDRKKQGKLIPLKEFSNESKRAQQIALERPRFWEYLLTEELLSSNIADIDRKFGQLKRGLVFRKSRKLGGKEFIDWASLKFDDILSIVEMIKVVITEEIPLSWGKPGEPGNQREIKLAIDKIKEGLNELFELEAELLYLKPSQSFKKLKQILEGFSSQIVSDVTILRDEIKRIFQQPNPDGKFEINIVFKPIPNIDAFGEEIKRLIEHKEEWINEY
jgi:hypothetical protein